jgi:hypothetical protein
MMTPRQLGIVNKPMGPTSGIGALLTPTPDAAAVPVAAPQAAPASTTFDEWWNNWGAAVSAISTIVFLLMALPGRRVR